MAQVTRLKRQHAPSLNSNSIIDISLSPAEKVVYVGVKSAKTGPINGSFP